MALTLYFPVSAFILPIQKTLQDEWGFVYDVETELIPLLNDAVSRIVGDDPLAVTFNMPFQLRPFYLGIQNGGGGYVQGNTITLTGGTFTTPIQVVVAGTLAGVITMIEVLNYGAYTVYPSNPIAQGSTSGSGAGATFNLTKVGPKQEIPPDGASLVEVRRNLGTDGQTMGPVITKVARDSLDADRPTWPEDVINVTAGIPTVPTHYTQDDRDAKRWYLWPMPNVMNAPWFVELIYRSVPNDVDLNSAFPLPALYQPAAKAYIIAHALARRDKQQNDAGIQALIKYWDMEYDKCIGVVGPNTARTLPSDQVNKP